MALGGDKALHHDELIKGPYPGRGVLFQGYALLPWLTVHENINFGPRLLGRPSSEGAEIMARFVAMAGLDGFEKRLPNQLSGGMPP